MKDLRDLTDGALCKDLQATNKLQDRGTQTAPLQQAEEGEVVARCEQRRVDPETSAEYHLVDNPPPDDPAVSPELISKHL